MKPLALAAALAIVATASAQDLNISQIGNASGTDVRFWNQTATLAGYSFATTSCNVGSVPVLWFDAGPNADQHPVIGQNFFRIKDGRIEQLGYSWLKHGFCAVNETSCGSCQSTNCDTLGLGCADTYSSGLNDGAGGAPKSEINANTGQITWPPSGPTSGPVAVRGRLQVLKDEIDPTLNPGAIYYAESQYVTEHDQMAGNGRNNVSYRRLQVNSVTSIQATGSIFKNNPAIYAWPAQVPGTVVSEAVIFDEGGPGVHGYFFVGYNATDLGGGLWRYEYAVQNTTSHQGAGSFSIPLSCGVNVSDVFFRDVDNHSGEIWENTDWVSTIDGNSITWACDDAATNPLANALRWGELYNFGFTADAPPATAQATLGMFKQGAVTSLSIDVEGPCGAPICGASNYCVAAPNSSSSGAIIGSSGSTSVSANNMSLSVTAAVPNQFGLFFYGPAQTQAPLGDGFVCVSGGFFRLTPPQMTNLFGDATRPVDFTAPPMSGGAGAITAGTTMNFQFWYRDPAAGNSGFNLSDGRSVTFCP